MIFLFELHKYVFYLGVHCPNHKTFLMISFLEYFLTSTNLREGNVFIGVYLSTGGSLLPGPFEGEWE